MDTLLGRCFFWMVTAHGIPGVIAVAAGIRFLRVHPHALVAVCKRTWLPSRSRGGWRWLRLLVVPFLSQYIRRSPLVPRTLSSRPQPSGVTETSLLARTQGRTLDSLFSTLSTKYCCRVASTSCGDDAARHVPACVVAKGATGLL